MLKSDTKNTGLVFISQTGGSEWFISGLYQSKTQLNKRYKVKYN